MTEPGLSPLDASQNEPRTGSAKATISSHHSKLSKTAVVGWKYLVTGSDWWDKIDGVDALAIDRLLQ
ncbi:uncharacterized protein ANIA_11441 [Aspergillus nidulans FGSC A4]|uniref:Uncharacterized protein n=1 Tax=Emericella nidulans (strain FGSC A4 / ATCC 38163 / CBS 112.46 / NRRL 194 / M139) TaxID=227321 RepID=C8V8A8_EMENI|nr:hypothetical protein [Aspergillus nidulans FGSC A4]CBF77335.1 TPA: hypothetical protein ANIA_11441 [Aspergillus nidulans FGSC A4]